MNVNPDSPMNEQAGALELLCSPAKIIRDKGIVRLRENLLNTNAEGIKQLEISVRLILTSPNTTWERKHGALMGFKEILMLSVLSPTLNVETGEQLKCSDKFTEIAKDAAIELLTDPESRVRIAAGEVMGCLCQRVGATIYEDCREVILSGVVLNLERQPLQEPSDDKHTDYVDPRALANKLSQRVLGGVTIDAAQSTPAASTTAGTASGSRPNAAPVEPSSVAPATPSGSTGGAQPGNVTPNRERRSSLSSEEIFHDTAGWKSLETWMTCLKAVIKGCASEFNVHVDQPLIDLIFKTLLHTNRFVRETGYHVLGCLVACNSSETGELLVSPSENAIYIEGTQFSKQLALGLADNWSQVRLAASVASRQFLLGLTATERESFYEQLLPPLCLNRYYVAEGVRIYNQDTWRQVVGTEGRSLVEKHMASIVQFYILQTEADNHAVREAACACIAELASKVDGKFVCEHVPRLLDALLVCFKDESWPVRDAACVASGDFIKCFPEGARPMMNDLYDLFFLNLEDSIASVRQGAAIALHNVFLSYGDEALEIMKPRLVNGLKAVHNQKMTSAKYFDGPGNYGVVKKLRDNDEDLHTNKQMYSCGSLAPKMHRGKRGGGCMDHQFRRASEAWEVTDGCVRLVAELSLSSIDGGSAPFAPTTAAPAATAAPARTPVVTPIAAAIRGSTEISPPSPICSSSPAAAPPTSAAPPTPVAPPSSAAASLVLPTSAFSRSPRNTAKTLSSCGKLVIDLMPDLIHCTDNRDFTQHVVLLETFCNSIPKISNSLTKTHFKRFIEEILDPIFYSYSTDNALTKAAADNCLVNMSSLLGPSILRGRVEMRNNPSELQKLSAVTSII